MILKYLKLKTIRTLREKYLDDFTCIEVCNFFSGFLVRTWYRKQVKKYAEINGGAGPIPFQQLAWRNGTKPQEERLKFLAELEQKVQEGLV